MGKRGAGDDDDDDSGDDVGAFLVKMVEVAAYSCRFLPPDHSNC
jgi:hypothetical protein